MTKKAYRKKPPDATMTRTEYRAALKTLGMSRLGAGKVLGLSKRQAQRVAAGHSKVPKPVAKLVRLMVKLNLKPGDVP
jgi:hypothetical protein